MFITQDGFACTHLKHIYSIVILEPRQFLELHVHGTKAESSVYSLQLIHVFSSLMGFSKYVAKIIAVAK